jgi:hypothetical protein
MLEQVDGKESPLIRQMVAKWEWLTLLKPAPPFVVRSVGKR